MSEPDSNKKYEYTYTLYGKKIVKDGARYIVYIPNRLAEYILSEYGGYIDLDIKVPTMYPKPKQK